MTSGAAEAGEPVRTRIRREVIRTERVRRELRVRLGPTQAIRLGLKLVARGLVASARRRPVQLTLRSSPTSTRPLGAARSETAVEGSAGAGGPAADLEARQDR